LHCSIRNIRGKRFKFLTYSLDTLDPFKFEIMTRRPGHAGVMNTLHTALASPELQSVKLNVVVVSGLNDHEVLDFAEMTKEQLLSVRFIEFMPFTGKKGSYPSYGGRKFEQYLRE
jgi:molybdenum cofactor biosynthesis enzyme MoaA